MQDRQCSCLGKAKDCNTEKARDPEGEGLAAILAPESDESRPVALRTLPDTSTALDEVLRLDSEEWGTASDGSKAVSLCLFEQGRVDFAAASEAIEGNLRRISEAVAKTVQVSFQERGFAGDEHCVAMDPKSATSGARLSEDLFGIESLTNFSSVRASGCVFRGKWMYEVILGTAGIQQLGWATLRCPFTNEEGVGDAPDSYAYDGKRRRKWNVSCMQYGEHWAAGDVIGCMIDLDRGEVSFCRNGSPMGVAYDCVRIRQAGAAYFPAISLSQNERCEVNFGRRPFVHPQEGFSALEAPPPGCREARYLLGCLSKLARLVAGPGPPPASRDDAVLLADLLAARLEPLLAHEYIVLAELLPALLELHGRAEPHDKPALVEAVSLLEATFDPPLFQHVVSAIFRELSLRCRCASFVPREFPFTGSYPYLALAQCLLESFERARTAWMKMPSFCATVEGFLSRKQPTAADLAALLPSVWWEGREGDDEVCSQERMLRTMAELELSTAKLEDAHYRLFCLLLEQPAAAVCGAPQACEEMSALMFFLQHLCAKNKGASRNVRPPGLSDNSVLVSAFFALLRMLRPHLAGGQPGLGSLPAAEVFVYGASGLGTVYSELPRLGGNLSFLRKETPVPDAELGEVEVPPFSESELRGEGSPLTMSEAPFVLDAMSVLYNLGVSTNFKAYSYHQQNQLQALQQLEDTERRLRRSSASLSGQWSRHLKETRSVFFDDVVEGVRYTTWYEVMLLSQTKRQSLFHFCAYVSRMLLELGRRQALFCYVPELYIHASVEAFHALRRQGDYGCPDSEAARGIQDVITFLVSHFADTRVIDPSLKDMLLQSISMLLQYRRFVDAFEANEAARAQLMQRLLDSFDNKFWVPVSAILLRLIRGRGFGRPAAKVLELASSVFQDCFREASREDPDAFNAFLQRLLNILNWTMTEFAVACNDLQELNREHTGHRVPNLQQHQRKCRIMFELSVNLERIVEFVALEVPAAFLRGSSLNIVRAVEIIRFILSHASAGPDGNPFHDFFTTTPNAEKISRPVMLAPVVGTLAGLWRAQVDEGQTQRMQSWLLKSRPGKLWGPDPQSAPLQQLESHLLDENVSCEPESLRLLETLPWQETFPDDVALRDTLSDLQQLNKRIADLAESRPSGKSAGEETDDVPEEFLDPIMACVMLDPVVLPDSGITVDRSTIERHLMSQQNDPFNRSALTVEMLTPDAVLKARIDEWVRKRAAH